MGMVNLYRNLALARLIAGGGPLDPAATFVGVFTSVVDGGRNTLMADLTRPTGAMALAVALASWGTPYNLVDGRRVADSPPRSFRPASSAEATSLAGWFFADAASAGNLLLFGLFSGAVSLPDENWAVSVLPRVTVDPAGRWEAAVVYNG